MHELEITQHITGVQTWLSCHICRAASSLTCLAGKRMPWCLDKLEDKEVLILIICLVTSDCIGYETHSVWQRYAFVHTEWICKKCFTNMYQYSVFYVHWHPLFNWMTDSVDKSNTVSSPTSGSDGVNRENTVNAIWRGLLDRTSSEHFYH